MFTVLLILVVMLDPLQDSLLDRMKHAMLRSMLDVKWKPSLRCVLR